MQTFQIKRENISGITAQQLALVYNQAQFLPFTSRVFSQEAFQGTIEIKSKSYAITTRKVLVNVLKSNYSKLQNNSECLKNIELLEKENTFTITTGHQLSAFTGPLYFIYKILHVIKQCEELKKIYPTNNFVPVYWMASEDHDYEEIKSFSIFNKTLTWETVQTGPVGRFSLDGFSDLKEQLKGFYSNHPSSEVMHLIEKMDGKNYADLFFKFIHQLFGKYGLLILDGDNRDLKRIFSPILKEELKTQFSYNAVEKTNGELTKDGLKLQVNAREINLFYIDKGIRARIIAENDTFMIEGKGAFSFEQLSQMIDETPECFSPNVILRPVYQECVLPNLCYVGGLGEISYWLQLKGVFDHVSIPYPLIQVRNSLLWIDSATNDKMIKSEMTLDRVFMDAHILKKLFVSENTDEELNFDSLDSIGEELKKALIENARQVDSNLENYGTSEAVKLEKQLNGFKEKLYRQTKTEHDSTLKSIDQIKERLFPNGRMQERSINFFQFCPDGHYSDKLDELMKAMNPFEGDLIVLMD